MQVTSTANTHMPALRCALRFFDRWWLEVSFLFHLETSKMGAQGGDTPSQGVECPVSEKAEKQTTPAELYVLPQF